jgi:hypothetical protein
MMRKPVKGDTLVDVIALSSPSGHMSRRARKAAQERLRIELFGKNGLTAPVVAQPSPIETLRRQARELRELAARGMRPRAYSLKATELELEAKRLEKGG